MPKARRARSARRTVYRWHRRFGLTTAAFVLVLALSGLALNHTDTLGLDRRFVGAAVLQDWYGLGVPENVVSFAAGDRRVTLLGDALYLEQERLAGQFRELTGAIAAAGLIHVVADGELLVLLPDGRLVERLGPVSGIPAGIEAVGLAVDARPAVIASGRTWVARDASLTDWEVSTDSIRRSSASAAPAGLIAALRAGYRDRMLTFERVLLDLHSGRIFGRAGPLVMDAAAVLFIALALTGFWMWLRRPPHAAPPDRRYENGASPADSTRSRTGGGSGDA